MFAMHRIEPLWRTDVDLEPFSRINPCGYAELLMTDLRRLSIDLQLEEAAEKLLPHFLRHLGLSAEVFWTSPN